jgi:hypothetical protein
MPGRTHEPKSPVLEGALRRAREAVLSWESARVREAMKIDSFLGKTLLIEREWIAGRITFILVDAELGV